MLKKSTDEMLGELLKANNIEQYMKENEAYFVDLSVAAFLSEYITQKGFKKSAVIKDAEISKHLFKLLIFQTIRDGTFHQFLDTVSNKAAHLIYASLRKAIRLESIIAARGDRLP